MKLIISLIGRRLAEVLGVQKLSLTLDQDRLRPASIWHLRYLNSLSAVVLKLSRASHGVGITDLQAFRGGHLRSSLSGRSHAVRTPRSANGTLHCAQIRLGYASWVWRGSAALAAGTMGSHAFDPQPQVFTRPQAWTAAGRGRAGRAGCSSQPQRRLADWAALGRRLVPLQATMLNKDGSHVPAGRHGLVPATGELTAARRQHGAANHFAGLGWAFYLSKLKQDLEHQTSTILTSHCPQAGTGERPGSGVGWHISGKRPIARYTAHHLPPAESLKSSAGWGLHENLTTPEGGLGQKAVPSETWKETSHYSGWWYRGA